MSNRNFAYTFKLSNSITRINLPYAITNVSKLKVKFVSYITATASQKIMTFKISQFNSNIYYDGTNIIKYSKIIALPPSTSTPIIYTNELAEPDVFIDDVVSSQNGITQLTIEILIDNLYSSDISASNPLHIEILIT
jgi:hypothetical protein